MKTRTSDRTRKSLEERGWTSGSVAELLDLKPEEARLVELRADLAQAIRRGRRQHGWTQGKLAKRLGSTQPKVSDLENGIGSLEQMLRALLVMRGAAAGARMHRALLASLEAGQKSSR